ncbi:MAG: hypothetical protein ACKO5K_09380 [Armatimonadota bacterium]
MKRSLVALAALASATLPVSLTHAQKSAKPKPPVAKAKAPAAPKLPLRTAEAVLDAASKAMGAEKSAAFESTVITGTLTMASQGINGTVVMKVKGKAFSMSQTIPRIGEIRMGFDGTTGWVRDPFNGLRELKGDELAQAKTDVDRGGNDWRKETKSATLIAPRKVAGGWCYVVRAVPKSGPPSTQYYDAKSLLLVRNDVVASGPTGKIPTESYFTDYREVEGAKMPFRTRSVIAGGQEVVIAYTKVETNVPVDAAEFAKPEK